jgi:hypothetical protein
VTRTCVPEIAAAGTVGAPGAAVITVTGADAALRPIMLLPRTWYSYVVFAVKPVSTVVVVATGNGEPVIWAKAPAGRVRRCTWT